MKAYAYARYSSDNQRHESIEAQMHDIRAYAEKNGYTIVGEFIDEAKSAMTGSRPAFTDMFNKIHSGIDAVIVHKMDRFGRDKYDAVVYKHKLKLAGVKLISVTEPMLDGSPESIILESVLEGLNQYYSVNLAREVLKGLKENARQGIHVAGIPPLGYDVDPQTKKYIVNPIESKAVQYIFNNYAVGKSYSEIINYLNLKGYKTKVGRDFTNTSLNSILNNEKYLGIMTYNVRAPKDARGCTNSHKHNDDNEIIRVPDAFPALIAKETWEEVKRKMEFNKRNNRQHSAHDIYLLTGIIFCGNCGASMTCITRHSGKDKVRYSSYECSSRKREKTCCKASINKDFIENAVLDYLINEVFSKAGAEKLADMVYDYVNKSGDKYSIKEADLFKNLRKIEKQLDNAVEMVCDGVDTPTLREKLVTLEKRKEEINYELDKLQAQKITTINSKTTKKRMIEWLDSLKNIRERPKEEQREIIRMFMQRIEIKDSGSIKNATADALQNVVTPNGLSGET